MKLISKKDAIEKKSSESCTIIEYPLQEKECDIALAIINGRYPESRRAMNQICHELAFVLEGDGKISLEGTSVQLQAGDVVLIHPGERYFWQGQLKLLLTCRPAWSAEQFKLVD